MAGTSILMVNEFLEDNYAHIVKMAEKITQSHESEEVAHYVISEFIEHKRANELVEKGEALKFISGMIWRSYHSTTSPYHTIYRRKGKEVLGGYQEYDFTNYDLVNEEYDTETDLLLDGIEGILEDM